MATNLTKKNGGEWIQIIKSKLRWVGDREGVGIDGEVKTQGGRRVGAIEGGGSEAMWLCGSMRVTKIERGWQLR